MANLKETAQWEDGIYRIELTDPVVGGEDGIDNIQAKQLGNRTQYLKKKLEGMEGTVDGYAPDMQEALFAGLKLGLDLGALAMKEHEQTRLTRFQKLRATVKNRGVKSGVTLSKSSTATRNISCSDGVVFHERTGIPGGQPDQHGQRGQQYHGEGGAWSSSICSRPRRGSSTWRPRR